MTRRRSDKTIMDDQLGFVHIYSPRRGSHRPFSRLWMASKTFDPNVWRQVPRAKNNTAYVIKGYGSCREAAIMSLRHKWAAALLAQKDPG